MGESRETYVVAHTCFPDLSFKYGPHYQKRNTRPFSLGSPLCVTRIASPANCPRFAQSLRVTASLERQSPASKKGRVPAQAHSCRPKVVVLRAEAPFFKQGSILQLDFSTPVSAPPRRRTWSQLRPRRNPGRAGLHPNGCLNSPIGPR